MSEAKDAKNTDTPVPGPVKQTAAEVPQKAPVAKRPMRPFAELSGLGQPLRESFSKENRDPRVVAHDVREQMARGTDEPRESKPPTSDDAK